MKTPPLDDLLSAFAIEWDFTPAMLTEWQRRFPLWADELYALALGFVRDRYPEEEEEQQEEED